MNFNEIKIKPERNLCDNCGALLCPIWGTNKPSIMTIHCKYFKEMNNE